MMNLFPLDVETTGLDPKKHEIIELAFSIIINGVKHCSMEIYMRPERWDAISPEALAVNGWTVEMLKRLPDKEHAWRTLINYIAREYGLPGIKLTTIEWSHNSGFDYSFLKIFWNGFDCPLDFDKHFTANHINVKVLSRKRFPKLKPHSLKDSARALGIPIDERQLHGAAYDRDLMVEVYKRLGGKF